MTTEEQLEEARAANKRIMEERDDLKTAISGGWPVSSQVDFTPLTPETLKQLTTDEVLSFEAAALAVAQDQKPSLEVIATLVLTVQRLIAEPAAAAELADLKRIYDREWRALWVITRQLGGDVFLTSAQLEEIPPLASLGTRLEPGGMRVNAQGEP